MSGSTFSSRSRFPHAYAGGSIDAPYLFSALETFQDSAPKHAAVRPSVVHESWLNVELYHDSEN